MKLESLLQTPEGKTLEFKRDLSSPRPILRTLVAFANSAGGDLVVGIEDATRHVVGVAQPLDQEERLANLVADGIEPQLFPEIELLPWRKTQVLRVRVAPSTSRPHHVKKDGPDKGTYVRLGSTNRLAEAALIAEMRRRLAHGSYDEEPVPGLSYETIDFAAVSQSFAGARKMRRQDLASLGLAASHQGRQVATIGGILLFGQDRLQRFPDAWIQAGAFAGTDKGADFLDRQDLRDYPARAIEHAIGFVQRNTPRRSEVRELHRRDLPAVPPVALREAIVNAVVHADYSLTGAPIRVAVFADRVEIENPGILLPGLTIEDLRDGVSRLRNRVVGRVFKELGLIEQWGSGIQRMSAACRSAGLPEPQFEEVGLRFRTTLRLAPHGQAQLDDDDRALVDYLDAPQGRSTAEVAQHLGRTTRMAQLRLARLQASGIVVAVGSGPRDPRRRWFRGRHAPGTRSS